MGRREYKTFDFIISLGVLILIKYFEANNEETKCCNYFTQNKISTFSKRITKQIFCYLFIYLFILENVFFSFLLVKRVFHFENPKKLFFSFLLSLKTRKQNQLPNMNLVFQ